MNGRQKEPMQPVLLTWLTWLRIMAGAACLIGTAGLIALMSQSGHAASPVPGNDPGSRVFTNSNPFAGSGGPGAVPPKAPFFGDDDEEDEDFEDDLYPPSRPGGMGGPGGGQPSYSPGNPPSPPSSGSYGGGANRSSGISGGGTAGGGVIANNKTPPLSVDTETAEGSREIVTDFNFPDADIMDIAKTLGKLTGKNFILDNKDVKGRVTIVSNSPITVGDAWKAFLTALDMNGFSLIPSGKYIRIARQRDARDKQLKTYTGDFSPDTDALITRVFPLKYLSAEEVARNFRSFMPTTSRIIPYEQTNTVIVTDTGSNIAKLNKLLEILDVEGYDAGIEVIPVKYASAAELSKLVDSLLPGTGPTTGPGAGPRFGGGGRSSFTARRTKEGGIVNNIIADDRTNTLIVHANTRGADQVRELVAKLDQKLPATSRSDKVHVYYLQFADSEQISNTLNNLSQTNTRGGGGPAGTGTGVNPMQQSLFEGNIRVAADKATNSLVITASPTDYVTVKRVINRLDVPRDQVYVEAAIMEMALNRDFNFSTNVALPGKAIAFTPNQDLASFLNNPLNNKGAIIGYTNPKDQVEIAINGVKTKINSFTALVKALQVNNVGNVLATPQILTLDNTEATFETAERIPFPTVTAVQGAGTSTSVSKENVALMVKIKPQLNKYSNFVKLDIEAKLEDISGREVPAQVAGLAVATTSRTVKTSVNVADSDTVVLGGLMRDNRTESTAKIPILGDIPLLGWLFRAKSSTTQKTNLLVFLTPHIIKQYENIRAVLDKKLRERDEFIEQSAGGEDTQRYYRDRIIRDLPDINSITSYKAQKSVSLDEDEKPTGVPENNSGNALDSQPQPPLVPNAGGQTQ